MAAVAMSQEDTIICRSLDLALRRERALRVYAVKEGLLSGGECVKGIERPAMVDSSIMICCCMRAESSVQRP